MRQVLSRVAARPAARLLRATWLPLLAVLLLVDVAFIAVHSASMLGLVPEGAFPVRLWSMDIDGSLPEFWGYALEAGVVAALLVVAERLRYGTALAWAACYAVVLVDDAVSLHERVGHALVDVGLLPPEVAGFDGQQVGELLAFGLIGLVPLVAVAVVHLRSGPAGRRFSWVMAGWFVALMFCAVVLDGAHAVLHGTPAFDGLLGVAEDGGELVVLSLTLAFAAGLARRRPTGPGAQGVPLDDRLGDRVRSR
ncbi:hypothetical protein ACI8AC_17750 [Geodermatophilus sp. SYSU D00758]